MEGTSSQKLLFKGTNRFYRLTYQCLDFLGKFVIDLPQLLFSLLKVFKYPAALRFRGKHVFFFVNRTCELLAGMNGLQSSGV